MCDEIEEGELSTDIEEAENDNGTLFEKSNLANKKNNKLNKNELDTKLNIDEKNELDKLLNQKNKAGVDGSDAESGELNENDNPYDEEDEMIIELKMKAFQSLLDQLQSSPKENSKQTKTKSTGKVKKKKKKQELLKKKKMAKQIQHQMYDDAAIINADEMEDRQFNGYNYDNNDINQQDDVFVIDKKQFNNNINYRQKLKNWYSKRAVGSQNFKKNSKINTINVAKVNRLNGKINWRDKNYFSNLEQTSLNKINSLSMSKDNYVVEDMDIEPQMNQPTPLTLNNQQSSYRMPLPMQQQQFSQFFTNPASIASFLLQVSQQNQHLQQQQQQHQPSYFNSNGSSATLANFYDLFNTSYNFLSQNFLRGNVMQSSNTFNSSNNLTNPLLTQQSNQWSNNNISNSFMQQQNQSSYNGSFPFQAVIQQASNTILNQVNKSYNQGSSRSINGLMLTPSSRLSNFSPNSINSMKTSQFASNKQPHNLRANFNSQQSDQAMQPTPPKVVFTLSSPSATSSSSISPQENSQKVATKNDQSYLTSSLLDLDERFIDKTSGKLDIDYRQQNDDDSKIIDPQLFKSILTVFNDKIEKLNNELTNNLRNDEERQKSTKKTEIEQREEEERKRIEKEKEEMESEAELMQMRKRLLENLEKKKKEKQQEEEEERQKELLKQKELREKKLLNDQQQELKMNEDINALKRKLEEQENELISKPKPQEQEQEKTQPPKRQVILNTNANNNILPFNPKKLSPIIIRINSYDCDDEDDENDDKSNKYDNKFNSVNRISQNNLQNTINLFLNEAKKLAIISKKNQPQNTPSPKISLQAQQQTGSSVSSTSKENENSKVSDNQELDKKDLIKSLRDRINSKSKTIIEFGNKSSELNQLLIKKEKDAELTRAKINMLREQLQVAEKILFTNEEAIQSFKAQKRSIDLKLVKIQNMKQTQQQLLQKILSSTPTPNTKAQSNSQVNQTKASNSSVTISSETVSSNFQPPLPPQEPQPPLPSVQVSNAKPPEPPPIASQQSKPLTDPKLPELPPEPIKTVTPIIPSVPHVSIKSLSASQMTLGSVVAATVASKSSNNISKKEAIMKSQTQLISRPNLFTSESTNLKLEKLAKESVISANIKNNVSNVLSSSSNNLEMVVDAKVVNISPTKSKFINNKHKLINNRNKDKNAQITHKNENELKKQELENRLQLIDCLNNLTTDYPYVHNESFSIWSNECIIQSPPPSFKPEDTVIENSNNKSDKINPKESSTFVYKNNGIHIIEDVSNYESPLKAFRGYRFSENFSKLSDFDEVYSKLYCNAIDFRRPFCPFDLHGSCKDSNCLYQHSNMMTMDNIQRTEHFLTYCPELLGLSERPTQKEAVKKLKAYAKTFMSTNLNRMSIKDYFKHLYDHIIANMKREDKSTVLTRIPILCLNNNKSIGVCGDYLNDFEYQDVDKEKPNSSRLNILIKNSETTKFGFGDVQKPVNVENQMLELLERVISSNMNRTLEIKLKYLTQNGKLTIDWLKDQQNEQTSTFSLVHESNELIIGWIQHAKDVYLNALSNQSLTFTDQIEKLLNVLSHSLECNPKCEILWLVYLKAYLCKRNSSDDYHEICMLCMDNLITYDLVWFMLNTCQPEFVDLLLERFERFLLQVDPVCLRKDFEQNNHVTEEQDNSTARVSFYLMEMILFNVYMKLNSETKNDKELLKKYLSISEITSKLDPNDLCILWLCLIHLEAFRYLPNWLRIDVLLNSRLNHDFFNSESFWILDKNEKAKRINNNNYFRQINFIYSFRNRHQSEDNQTRKLDLFLLPWNQKNGQNHSATSSIAQKHNKQVTYSIDKVQNMLYEALKAVTTRCASLNKQKVRLICLPLFINLINLEVSNKRFDTAIKLCERLLKSSDAEMLKELWLSLIYIKCQQHKSINNVNDEEIKSSIEETLSEAIKKFPFDAQIVFVAAQYYKSVNKPESSIKLLEEFISQFYTSSTELNPMFFYEHLLGLNKNEASKSFNNELKLSLNIKNPTDSIDFNNNLLNISICYCYYMELTSTGHDYVCSTFEHLIHNFQTINHRSVLWSRYLKYVAQNLSNIASLSQLSTSNTVLLYKLANNCFKDLNQVSTLNNKLLIPFNNLPKLVRLQNSNENNDNNKNNYFYDSYSKCIFEGIYYKTSHDLLSNYDADDDNYKNNDSDTSKIDYYYHNCLIDVMLKLFDSSLQDKFSLISYLVNLMPKNSELIKLFVNFSVKLNGTQKTLQMLYDHLTINSIDNEHLWILCIDICLELNDLQQAILIYQKAEFVCIKTHKSIIELKKLSKYLFPSTKNTIS